MTQAGDTARVAMAGNGDLDAAAARVRRFLALDVDGRGWPEVGRRDPVSICEQSPRQRSKASLTGRRPITNGGWTPRHLEGRVTVGEGPAAWDIPPVEAVAPDGTVIGWEEIGSGRPVCLVHGGVADSAMWSGVRALLPDGLRVAAMDRRGRGRSGRGDDERYSLEVEADDILCVAEALAGGVVVVAHSIAATITLQALCRADGLITGA